MVTLASIAVTRSRERRTHMHAQWRRAAVIVAALTFAASPALAAEKPGQTSAKSSGHATTVSATVGSEAKVNINTADAKELTTLSGISPRLAERIVAYRDANGP